MHSEKIAADGKQLDFPIEEYRVRLDGVRAQMRQRGFDALLSHTPENILYLTGYRTPGYYAYQCLLVRLEDDPILLIRNGEIGSAHAYSWPGECATYFDGQDAVEATVETLRAYAAGARRVGIEMNAWFLTAKNYEELRHRAKELEWPDASGIVEACRARKSPREIEYIRQAARTAEAGMRAAIEVIAPGKTDNDVAAALHEAMIRAGSEYAALGPFVATGGRSSIMHGIWGRNRIEPGDSIILEIGGVINRYNAALMRGVSVGPPDRELEAMAAASEEANRRLIENIKPGAYTADLHSLCMAELTRHGYGATRKGRRCGYSIGLAFAPDWGEGHIISMIDRPNLMLEPGMVFHLPLSVRIYGKRGVSFSETVAVTETSHEVLTKFERKLFVR